VADINFNDLGFDNIGAWPQPVRIAVVCFVAVLIIGLGYWFDTRSQLTTLAKAERKERTLRVTFEKKAHDAANFQAYKRQLVQMQKMFKDLLQRLPEVTEVPGLLEDVSAIGHAHGLKFYLFKPLPEVHKEFYSELPINIKVIGSYHQLAEFISDVSALDRIVTIDDFDIQLAKTIKQKNKLLKGKTKAPMVAERKAQPEVVSLEMKLTAKTYRYTEEKEGKS